MRIVIPAASLRDPAESEVVTVSQEEGLFCDGSECRAAVFSEDGELELLPPHWHMIERGKSPEAGPRCYAVFGE